MYIHYIPAMVFNDSLERVKNKDYNYSILASVINE